MSFSEGAILVVDDDSSVRGYLSSLLCKSGFSTIVCAGATEAISKLEEHPIALILSDIKMPEVSGIDLLEQIQRFNAEIPVILMTGYGDLELAIEVVNKGAFSFLTKPFNQEYLMTLVQRGLERYVQELY